VNRKMIPGETNPGMGKGGLKENDGGADFWYIVRTFINVTMDPHSAQQK
jgi:hypothetical protein